MILSPTKDSNTGRRGGCLRFVDNELSIQKLNLRDFNEIALEHMHYGRAIA